MDLQQLRFAIVLCTALSVAGAAVVWFHFGEHVAAVSILAMVFVAWATAPAYDAAPPEDFEDRDD